MAENNTNRNNNSRLSGETDYSTRTFRKIVEEGWSSDGEASNSESFDNNNNNMIVHESWEEHLDESDSEDEPKGKVGKSGHNDEDELSESDLESNDKPPVRAVAPSSRVKRYQGYSWSELLAMPAFKSLTKLAERVDARYTMRKLTPQVRRDMDAGLINRDALDGTVLNIKSSIGQIIRWLKGASRDDDSIKFNLKALCYPKVFGAWYQWALDYWNCSPQTPVNKCLAYKNLLDWMLTRDSFKDLSPKIQKTLRKVNDGISGLKRQVNHWKFKYANAKKLVQRGEMLTSDQLLELNRKVWDDLKRGIDKVKNNLDRTKQTDNVRLAYRLQTDLQVLLFLRLTGQRREFVAGLDDDQVVILEDGRLMLQPIKEKKVRESGHGLEQDELMSKMLKWFKDHVRPLLGPGVGVKAWWLDTKGQPQAGKYMSKKMKRQINEFIPGTSITPASIRRQYATMFEAASWTADMDENHFWRAIAGVMNTGTQTLDKHYKRVKSPQKQTKLLARINHEWNQDEDIEDKMRAMEQLMDVDERPELPDHPMEDLAEYEVAEIIDKHVSMKGGLQYKVRWEGYTAEDATWEKLSNLESALKAVEEYEVKTALEKNKSNKKKKKKKRVVEKKKPAKKKKVIENKSKKPAEKAKRRTSKKK
jgi:hypothetical protein